MNIQVQRNASVREESMTPLQRQAELILLEDGAEAAVDMTVDTRRLLHNLQVHQVELEIQNENLRRSQLRIEASRDSFANLFEFSPVGYLCLDSRMEVTQANLAAAELFEKSQTELLGRTVSRFIVPADADLFHLHCRKVMATKQKETCDIRMVQPSGNIIFVQIHSFLLPADESGEEVFLMALSDITAREHAHQVLEQSQSLLEASVRARTNDLEIANESLVGIQIQLRKLSSAVKQSRSSIIISDKNDHTEYVNPRFTELTGYTFEEMCENGTAMLHTDVTPQDTLQEMSATIHAGGEWRGTLQTKRKDGAIYWEEICISPIADELGEITHYLRVGEDITRRKASEERQDLLMAELDHRVKNTLSVVISIARQTLRTSEDFLAFREAFEGRLMALARVHRLLTQNHWGPIPLQELVELATKPYTGIKGPFAKFTGPEIELSPKDAQSIHLVFHELVTNAAKYGAFTTPTGQVEVIWDIRESESGEQVQLRWRETGGPAPTDKKPTGFGHELIERTIVNGLGGEAAFNLYPAGAEWKFVFPLPSSDS